MSNMIPELKSWIGKKYASMVIIRSNVKSYGTMCKIGTYEFIIVKNFLKIKYLDGYLHILLLFLYRIRRFRIMAELIPDARTWISQPWTNFYKSKDHNRHPDMPKKPLSMYMLFYSEKREEILRSNSQLSMPEVAKICSEQYQKLSDKKKAKYKQRCDDMRRLVVWYTWVFSIFLSLFLLLSFIIQAI